MNLYKAKIISAVYNSIACAVERGENISDYIVVQVFLGYGDFWTVRLVLPRVKYGYHAVKTIDGGISQPDIVALASEAVADFIACESMPTRK